MTQVMDEYEVETQDFTGDTSALAALNRSEIDMQISTAKKYPRSIAKAKRNMIEMATLDKETARSCNYALKRYDSKTREYKWIEGPSIRMAEIAVSCWGNIRYGARVISEDDRFVTAQGVCHDLETNVASAMEVRRRITTKNGQKFGDDMVGVTANAACAIAARNAVFKVVPKSIINEAAKRAMDTMNGDAKEFGQTRQWVVGEFKKLDVDIEHLLKVVGKPTNGGIEDLDSVDLRRLLGLHTAIQDGETTIDKTFFGDEEAAQAQTQKTADLNQSLKTNRPVSPGQTLEDDNGNVIAKGEPTPRKSPEQQSQADLQSHDFARPGADEQESKEPDVPPAEEHADPETGTPSKMHPREMFIIGVEEACANAGIPWDQAAKNALKKWALGAGPKNDKGSAMAVVGKEHEATAEAKTALFDCIKQRRGHFAYAAS